GTTLVASASLRPGNHTEISASSRTRWLNVHDGPQVGRLFVAQVERLRTTYTINAQSFVRVIAQHVRTDRDPTLYTFSGVEPRTQDVSVSGLFAYKVNWQTVLYLGYGDQREYLESTGLMEQAGHQLFAKVSYAWQQ